MFRRDFLKLSGLFSSVVLTAALPRAETFARPIEAEFGNRLYRGTADGMVIVSTDNGKTWGLHTRFGSHLSVAQLRVDLWQRLVAVLRCEGYDFQVALSPDLRTWRTV